MDINLAGVHPLIAMPTHRDINPATVRSLLMTQAAMQERNLPLSLKMEDGCSLIHHARTRTTDFFLTQTDCTHLFWIDSDVVWAPDDFLKIVALGTKMECVLAAYPRKADEVEFYIRYKEKRVQSDEYGCVAIEGTGMGFSCVQRKVMQELSDQAKKLIYADKDRAIPAVFRCDDDGGYARGEDYAFFADILKLGYDVKLCPNIQLGHVGQKNYTHSVWECIKAVDDNGEVNEVPVAQQSAA